MRETTQWWARPRWLAGRENEHGLEYLLHKCVATERRDGAADENARATGSEVDRCTLNYLSD